MSCYLPKHNETLRAYSERHARTSNSDVINHQKTWRLQEIENALKQATIEPHHIQHLDRIARFTIASEHYPKCSNQTQLLLEQDENHFVRSAAQNAKQRTKCQ